MVLYERINTVALADLYTTDPQSKWLSAAQIGGLYRYGMAFTIGQTGTNEANTLSSFKIKLVRYGSPGTLQCNLYLADANHKPTGAVLAAGTVLQSSVPESEETDIETEVTIEMTPSYVLAAGTEYCFILIAPSGDASNVYWGTTSGYGEE